MKKRRVHEDAWRLEGATESKSHDMDDWVFRCPSCGQPQTKGRLRRLMVDVLGMNKEYLDRAAATWCIGTFLAMAGSREVVQVNEKSRGSGCLMRASDGLLPVTVVYDEQAGDEQDVMEWA